MHRIFGIVVASLTLAACSSMNLDALKPAPLTDTVRFESEPPGAEAKLSNGQTCTTPCSLSLPETGAYSVVFSLNGYQPVSEDIQLVSQGDGTSKLRPNPVLMELTPAPPPPKPAKKPTRKRPVAKKKAAPAKPAAQAAPAPAPAPAAPPPAQTQPAASSPWPATPPPPQQ